MSNLLLNQKLFQKNISLVKENLYYYKSSKNHLLKTSIISISKFLIIELNLKSSFKIIQHQSSFSNSKKLINLFLIQKNQNCALFDNFVLKKLEKLFFVTTFLKQIFLLKRFVKGRIYHFFKNGFIVALNGLICFLPINNCSYINFKVGKLNIFFLAFFNEHNTKTIILSQRNIYKKIHSTLFKMTSRLLFLKNFMAGVTQSVRVLNCEFKNMSSILIVCLFFNNFYEINSNTIKTYFH